MTGLEHDLRSLAGVPRLLVACDFDGTLSELVDDPAAAAPVEGALQALTRLAGLPGTRTALVSGRSRHELRRLARPPDNVALVGSHGAELDGGAELTPPDQARLAEVVSELAEIARHHPGALVETKPAGAAFHYRRVERDRIPVLVEAIQTVAARHRIAVLRGKEVVELPLRPAGKGEALALLRRRYAADGVFYAGDDVTDEDAFAALEPGDLGIKVGPGPTAAAHRLPGPQALVALLQRLADLRAG